MNFQCDLVTRPGSILDGSSSAGFLKRGVVFMNSLSASHIYTQRWIIRLDELFTMIRLTRRTITIARLDV